MPPPRARAARRYDPGRTREALLAQAGIVLAAVRALEPSAFGLPTRLGGWRVHELVAHLVGELESYPAALAAPPPGGRAELTPAAWALTTAPLAERLDARTRAVAERAPDPPAALERLAAAEALLREALALPPPDRLVDTWSGPMTATGMAVTRLVELVVHADDLAEATGVPAAPDRQALAAAVRVLADAFAAKAPGNAVELRVPPYAAVQCLPGPRHTRGTPGSVVETDPVSWIRLACGRLEWSTAVADALVSAGGERADLSAQLPVLG